jgi:hypothetical protein
MFDTLRIAAIAALLSTPSFAVTYAFTAEVITATEDQASLADTLVDRARPFTTLTGTFTIDPTPLGPSPAGGTLYGDPEFVIDQFTLPTLTSTVPGRVQVVNDFTPPFSSDAVDFFASSVAPGVAPTTHPCSSRPSTSFSKMSLPRSSTQQICQPNWT